MVAKDFFQKSNKFFLSLFLVYSSVFLLFSLFSLIKKEKVSLVRPSINVVGQNQISVKKGLGGPITNNTAGQAKISWYYSWSPQPPSGLWITDSGAKFIPHYTSSGTNWCRTPDNLTHILADAQVGCDNNYCDKGNYYLIGNEPFQSWQDLRTNSQDPVLDAVNCYGEIIRRIKTKDSTAKFIILGLAYESGDRGEKARQFISRWKNHWQTKDSSIADLTTLIKGWHFHTYHNYFDCPASDSRAIVYKNLVDSQLQSVYGKQVTDEEIWVTEMGSLTSPLYPNDSQKQKFSHLMECLVNAYEASSVVYRYAGFYHGCNPALGGYCDTQWHKTAFFSPSGSTYAINYLGQKYASLASGNSGNPTPTLPPNGQSVLDQKNENNSISQVIGLGWGYGGPLEFTPAISGKLDKIELSVSGTGRIQVKIIDKNGDQVGDIVEEAFNTGKTWLGFSFGNPVVLAGEKYTILFRDPNKSEQITLYRGVSWSWAFKEYVTPEEIVVTPTPTDSIQPTNPPPQTPTPLANKNPEILASYLPDGTEGVNYSYTFQGFDPDGQDYLTMRIYGLPKNLTANSCNQTVSNGQRIITCPVSGIPEAGGNFYGYAKLSDSSGNTVNKNFKIVIQPQGP